MGQVTIYIDADTEKKLNLIIKKIGISKSKWISNLIKEKTSQEWPEDIINMAGSWTDFPMADELRGYLGKDSDREAL